MVGVGCVWEVSWRRGRTVTYWLRVLLTIAALLRILAGLLNCLQADSNAGLLNSLQADFHAGILSPTDSNCNWNSNWLKQAGAPGYILVWRPTASCGRTHLHPIQPRPLVKVIFRHIRPDAPASLFFRLFTQVHLLIGGSVERQ